MPDPIGMYIDHFLVGVFVPLSPPQESPLPEKSPPHSGGDRSLFLSKKVPLTVGVTPPFFSSDSPPGSPLLWGWILKFPKVKELQYELFQSSEK